MSSPASVPPVIVIDSVEDESTDAPEHNEVKSDISNAEISPETAPRTGDSSAKSAQTVAVSKSDQDKMTTNVSSDKSSSSSLTVPTLATPNGSPKERRRHSSKDEELKHLTEDVS